MKYIRTPTGETFLYSECKIFDDDFCNDSEVFFNLRQQEELAKELFDSTGIIVSEFKGGENTG